MKFKTSSRMTTGTTQPMARPTLAGRLADRSLEGLCRAILPVHVNEGDIAANTATLKRFLAHQPAYVNVATRMGAGAVDLLTRAVSGRSLQNATTEDQERVMSLLTRTTLGSNAMEGLKALVLLAAGSEMAAAEILETARNTDIARPDAVLNVTPSISWPQVSQFDAVVIGSGAGGAMAAMELAGAGMSVAILEEGRRWTVEEFRTIHPLDRFAGLYRDGGSTVALGQPPVVLPIGRAVGGTTVVNSGTCYKTPKEVLLDWRDEAGFSLADPDSLMPELDRVWELIQVGPVPLDVMGINGRTIMSGAEKLGWSTGPLDRNAPGCGGTCQCAIGCPKNAKFGVHMNALPRACESGARIISEARVSRIMVENGRAAGVLAYRSDGSAFKVLAPRVIVAAGTTESPLLLRRSGLGKHHMIGMNMAIHPAIGVAGRFEEPVVAWHGVLQSAYVDQLHAEHGVLLEATSTPPGMGSMILPGFGSKLVTELEQADHLGTLGGMVADLSVGRVIGRNRGTMIYNLSKRDGRRLLEAIRGAGKVLLAAGAMEILTGIPGQPPVRSEQELDDTISRSDPKSLHPAAFHPVGTVAAGSDPGRFPVEPTGSLRGTSGVWVADGSLMPTCPGVNPQVTIMALSLAVAKSIINQQ
ncbi:MAG: GMC family oxidoreductase [Actinobacteria bacterium]|nr:GMC family oxidoreductase [Actinomycetota bacterium]MCL5446494.1 GMC family oxidoreductase [Actinomycetota bacterium]